MCQGNKDDEIEGVPIALIEAGMRWVMRPCQVIVIIQWLLFYNITEKSQVKHEFTQVMTSLNLIFPDHKAYNIFFNKVEYSAKSILDKMVKDNILKLVDGIHQWPDWTRRWLRRDWNGDISRPIQIAPQLRAIGSRMKGVRPAERSTTERTSISGTLDNSAPARESMLARAPHRQRASTVQSLPITPPTSPPSSGAYRRQARGSSINPIVIDDEDDEDEDEHAVKEDEDDERLTPDSWPWFPLQPTEPPSIIGTPLPSYGSATQTLDPRFDSSSPSRDSYTPHLSSRTTTAIYIPYPQRRQTTSLISHSSVSPSSSASRIYPRLPLPTPAPGSARQSRTRYLPTFEDEQGPAWVFTMRAPVVNSNDQPGIEELVGKFKRLGWEIKLERDQ